MLLLDGKVRQLAERIDALRPPPPPGPRRQRALAAAAAAAAEAGLRGMPLSARR